MKHATRLRETRRQRKLTQEELARQAGTSLRYLQYLEAGHGRPRPRIANDLADVLEAPVSYLWPEV